MQVDWKTLRETASDVDALPPRIDPQRPLGHLSDADLQRLKELLERRRSERRERQIERQHRLHALRQRLDQQRAP